MTALEGKLAVLVLVTIDLVEVEAELLDMTGAEAQEGKLVVLEEY